MRWFLLVILLLSLLSQMQGEILELGITTDKEAYEAQERGVISLVFTNSSGQLVENVEITIKGKDFLFFDKTATIETVDYRSEPVRFKFQCKNLQDGKYPVYITYDYKATSKICQGGVCQKMQGSKQVEITVRNGSPHISLLANTLKVVNQRMVITFRNSDELAMDFQFEIVSNLQLQYRSYIGSLLSSASEEIVVYGEPGEYDGSVIIKYRDRFGRTYEKTFQVKIIIEDEKEAEKPALKQEEAAKPLAKSGALNPVTTSVEGSKPVIKVKDSGAQVRKIKVTSSPPEGDLSEYFVYCMMFFCLSIIGIVIFAKLKNIGRL